ncbi:GNAT family N-acetyltransferase [Periweissella cryptocerci]|uniref:GNAT family N-acetyltransferase n=1 Tax=Periweissella cryptocerci TaxID=2506420 RepID=UPI003C12BFFE
MPKNIYFVIDARCGDYQRVAELLNQFGLNDGDENVQRATFNASHGVAFLYDGDRLIGCGRVLSDGISQAAIYNIAIDVGYHGQHLGQALMQHFIERYRACNIILYTHPETIGWYEKIGFHKMNTGLAIFAPSSAAWMQSEGFFE